MYKHCLILPLLLLLSSYSPAAEFSFTRLGGLPGGNFDSFPSAMSADGTVVVGSANTGFGERAFRWTREGGMVALGDLPGGQEYSVGGSGKSVSANGNTIVGYAGSSNAQAEAFRWTQAGGMVGLGALAPGGYRSVAWGVSGDGSTVVGYAETETTSTQAFRWTAADGMVPLSGVTGNSIAFAASGDGSVVVGRNQNEAFRWTSVDGPIGLGFLPGTTSSAASAMTPDGSVIIGTSTSTSGTRGFRWTATGGMIDIGALGPTSTSPMALSDDGRVIVGNAEGSHPFIWTEEGGIADLQSHLTALGLDLTGWRLTSVSAISADGTVIAGDGMNPRSSSEGWVAVIPEPPTWSLAAFGTATFVFSLWYTTRRCARAACRV